MTDLLHKSWWHELHTWEPEAALTFYSRTLGWEFEPMSVSDSGGYWLAKKDGRPVGGVFELTEPDYDGTPTHWMTYLEVDDVRAVGSRTRQAGGHVVRDPVAIPGLGTLAVVADNEGAMIGLLQPERNFELSVAA